MCCVKRVLLVLIVLFSFGTCVYAEDENINYTVIDYSDESHPVLYSTNDYLDAYYFYSSNIYNYKNLCLLENDNTILMEYGTLYINSDEDVVTYFSIIDEKEKALSNYKDYELLYISESDGSVEFSIGGDIGLIYKDEVTYYPYGTHCLSYFDVKDNTLIHHVASSIDNYYKYNLSLDINPDYLNSDTKYYSYDGHYFYDDFYTLSDDYYLQSKENAINSDDPYYNYYAYLPSRSYTNYTVADLNNFINNTLSIKGRIKNYVDFDLDGANDVVNRSEYYNNMKAFISAEKIYGVNALTSLAWSSEESSFGKSKDSFIKSNVYSHEAFTGLEIGNQKYSSVKSSIYSHMENYVSKKYCDNFSNLYVGSHIGDFMSGIASIYSYDPLFSDKVVSKAYFYDSSLGFKDRNNYTIGITNKDIALFYSKELDWSYDIVRGLKNYSLIILEDYGDIYKVQVDHSMNQTGEYNPEKCIAFVKKSSIDKVIEGKEKDIKYNHYLLNTGDESRNNQYINLYSKEELDIRNDFVYKDIKETEIEYYVLENNVYNPRIKKITNIECKDLKYPSINNNGADISNGRMIVTYSDGSTSIKELNGDYVTSVTNTSKATTIGLSYNGITSSKKIEGDYDINLKDSLDDFDRYNDLAYSSYSFEDVEKFDTTFSIDNVNDISTYVKENDYDLNVAGAYPSFIYHSTDKLSNIINTYYFDVKKASQNSLVHNVASGYGLEFVDGVDISISRCFYKIDLVSPIIMQVKLKDINKNNIYTVYHKTHDGDIIKVPTRFSDNYVKFMAIDDGIYYIYTLPTASTYSIDDNRLVINMDSNGVDYYEVAEEGIRLIVISTIGYMLYGVYLMLKRKENRNWKDYRKLLQQAEFAQEEKQNS